MTAPASPQHSLGPPLNSRKGELPRLLALLAALSIVFLAWAKFSLLSWRFVGILAGAGAGACASMAARRGLRAIGNVLLCACTLLQIACFYLPWGFSPGSSNRAHASLVGALVLALCAFCALSFALLYLKPHASRWLGQCGVVLGLAIVLLIPVDLLFVRSGGTLVKNKYWDYHPFLVCNRADTYAYCHATERVVADQLGVKFEQKKPDDTLRVIVNGASTALGYKLDDAHAPARLLQKALKPLFPGRRVELLTLAFCGKYQLNELIDTVVTMPHWAPDLVISLNGFNEIWYGESENLYEGMPYLAFLQEADDGLRPHIKFFCQHSYLGASLWRRRIEGFRARHRVRDPIKYDQPRYYSYLRLTARNLARLGVPYVYAFCPNVYERPTPTAQERAAMVMNEYGGTTDLGKAVAERRQAASQIVRGEGQIPYDVMAVFADVQESVFVDKCHLNERGVALLVASLASKIPGWLAAWRAPSAASAERGPK